MRILVAGGAGYIGSNMVAMLSGHGHTPIVIDNLSMGHKAAIKSAEFIEGDLADYDLLLDTLRGRKIDAVMHFAAFIEAGESVRQPLKYFRNNTANTCVLLSAMQEAGVEKFVFSSTAAVYGVPDQIPITEDCPTRPINPYGESKLAAERICHHQAQADRLRYASLRYFNACGAGNDSSLGEDHRPESHLIPLAIGAAMGKLPDIKIFGTDYPTPDGTCIRDYIHVEDLCSAHLLALERLNGAGELVYNLGNGTGYSVRQVIEAVKKVTGSDFKVTEADRRPGDATILTSDATKAKSELGWETRFEQLEDIVRSAYEFHKNYPNGYDH